MADELLLTSTSPLDSVLPSYYCTPQPSDSPQAEPIRAPEAYNVDLPQACLVGLNPEAPIFTPRPISTCIESDCENIERLCFHEALKPYLLALHPVN